MLERDETTSETQITEPTDDTPGVGVAVVAARFLRNRTKGGHRSSSQRAKIKAISKNRSLSLFRKARGEP